MTLPPSTLAVAASPEIPADVPGPGDEEASLLKRPPKTPMPSSASDFPKPLMATFAAADADRASHGGGTTPTASAAVAAPRLLSPLSPSAAAWGRPLPPLPAEVNVNVNPALTKQLQDMILSNITSAKSTKGQKEWESSGEPPASKNPKDNDMSKQHEQQQKQVSTSPVVPALAAIMAKSSPDDEVKKSQAKDESKSTLKTMDSPVVVVEEEAAGKEEEKEISTFKLVTTQREQHDVLTRKKGTGRRKVTDKNNPLPLTGEEWPSQPAQQLPMQTQQCKEEQEQLKKQESAAPEQAFPVAMERGVTNKVQLQKQQQLQKQKQEGIKMTVSMNASSTAVIVQQPWEATKQERQKRKNQKKQEFATLDQTPPPATEERPFKQVQQQQPNAHVQQQQQHQHQHQQQQQQQQHQQQQQQQHHQGQQQKEKGGIESRQALLPARERRPSPQQQQLQQHQNDLISVQCTDSSGGQQQQQRQETKQQKQLPPAPTPSTTSLPRTLIPGPTITLAHAPPTSSVERIRKHLAALDRSGTVVMESLPVPLALTEWTCTHAHELNNILTQTWEKSDVLSIILEEMVKEDGGQERGKKVSGSKSGQVLVITAMSTEEAHRAKTLLKLHLKNQQQILRTARRLQKVQNEYMMVEKEVAMGLRVEFVIRKELGRIVVGKKGERVKRVLAETGVSSINVGDDGMIRVVGPTAAAVIKARAMLELVQEDIHVPLEAEAWLSRSMLEDLKQKSGCVLLRTEKVGIQVQQEKETSVSRKVTVVRIVGTRKQVENARLLVDTQIEYGGRHQAMRSSEEQMLQMLNHAEASYRNKSGPQRFQVEQRDLQSQQQPHLGTGGFPHAGGSKGRSSARRGGGGDNGAMNQGVRPHQQQQRKPLSASKAASVQDSSRNDRPQSAYRSVGLGKAAPVAGKMAAPAAMMVQAQAL